MTENFMELLRKEFMSPDLTNKIKDYLLDSISADDELISEYTSDERPKCDDGSDDFIEGHRCMARKLLLQIRDWEKTYNELN